MRAAVVALAAVVVTIAGLTSCGRGWVDAEPAGASERSASPDRCSVPDEGCPCAEAEEGDTLDCGSVRDQSGAYVTCEMGTRTCSAGVWTACAGDRVVTKTLSSGVSTRALGAPQPCPTTGAGAVNPCDPYCHVFDDDPAGIATDGGVETTDAGLTIPGASSAADGGGARSFVGAADGKSLCTPDDRNAGPGKTGCSAAPYATCQQDSRCEADQCYWNGGPGWFDSAAAEPDLTVGAPCGPAGSAPSTVPICNRGGAPVPAGATITLHQTTGASPPNGCADLGPPTFSFALPSPLAPGACVSYLAANSAGAKFVTVNAGSPGPVAEAPGRCANNSAYWRTDGEPGCGTCVTCDTRITGKVYDPSGVSPTVNANDLPLAGVSVFQPSGALKGLTDGVACDSCSSLESPFIAKTATDAAGSFTLTGVAPGPTTRVVVQSGRWRREVTMNVPACQTTAVSNGTLRMPQSRAEGDIPKMALVLGDQESLECMLRRVGIAESEIKPRAAGQAARIQLWQTNGMKTTPTAPHVTGLVDSASILGEYTAILWDCDGGNQRPSGYSNVSTTTQRNNLQAYTNVGGRMFMNHWPGDLVRFGPTPNSAVTTWEPPTDPGGPKRGKVLQSSAAQKLFHEWLEHTAGAMTDYGASFLRVDQPRKHALVPDPARTVEWIRGQSNDNWAASPSGNMSFSFSFETPVGAASCGVPGGRGRVIYNGMHVSGARHTGGGYPGGKTFPSQCNLTQKLTPEEKALVYQLFQLTACELGGEPPPPAPTPLPTAYFTRDYEGVCAPGEYPVWQHLYWRADVPPGTSIEFRAATSDDPSTLPAAPPPDAPATVAAGSATATVLAPAWARDAETVSAHLASDPPGPAQRSERFLRLYMTFNPLIDLAPTLTEWRMTYSCVPGE